MWVVKWRFRIDTLPFIWKCTSSLSASHRSADSDRNVAAVKTLFGSVVEVTDPFHLFHCKLNVGPPYKSAIYIYQSNNIVSDPNWISCAISHVPAIHSGGWVGGQIQCKHCSYFGTLQTLRRS